MSTGGAFVAGAAGGVKTGFKWWALKVGAAVGISVALGVAAVATGGLFGVVLGIGAALGLFGAFSFGGLIAGAGFLKGSASSTKKYLDNEQSLAQQQTQQLAAENDMRRENLRDMGMMNPGAPQDGRFAAMETARRSQVQANPTVPPL